MPDNICVSVRVYEELNDFIKPERRKRTFTCDIPSGATVSQLLTDLGIPADSVDLVLAGDASVGLSHRIRDGERISIYPMFETLDIAGTTKVRGEPLRNTRFLADSSLGDVAALLNRLGFDTTLSEGPFLSPGDLHRAELEERILLTRKAPDTRGISRVLVILHQDPHAQLRYILSRLDLDRDRIIPKQPGDLP